MSLFKKNKADIQYYVSGYLIDVRMNHFKCESLKEAKGILKVVQEVKPEYKWVIEEEKKTVITDRPSN